MFGLFGAKEMINAEEFKKVVTEGNDEKKFK